MIRTFAAAALVLLIAAPAAAETCSQAQLGTTSKPLNWSLHAPSTGGRFVSCKLTIRGSADVRGSCTSEATSNAQTVSKSASRMRVTTACALSGTIVAGNIAGSLVGTFTAVDGFPRPRGYGTMKRTKPTAIAKMPFTLLRLP